MSGAGRQSLPQPCGNVVQDCGKSTARRQVVSGRLRSCAARRPARPLPTKVHVGIVRVVRPLRRRRALGDRPGRQPRDPRRSRSRGRVTWRLGIAEQPVRARLRRGERLGRLARTATASLASNPTTKRRAGADLGGRQPLRAHLRRRRRVGLERRLGHGQPHRAEAEQGREDDPRRRPAERDHRRLQQGLGRRLRPRPSDPDRPGAQPHRAAHLAAEGRLDHAVGRRALGLERDRRRSTRSTRCRSPSRRS